MRVTVGRAIIAVICVVLLISILLYLRYTKWGALPYAARQALENGEEFELLSLEPTILRKDGKDAFHRWKILGRMQITNQTARSAIVREFVSGVGYRAPYNCFDPRHAIRVTWKGVTHDFVICFECQQVEWFRGADESKWILINGDPEPPFDSILRRNGIPLAPKDMMTTYETEKDTSGSEGNPADPR